jgi:hypothetical protein
MPRLAPPSLRALTAAAGVALLALHAPANATTDSITVASACTADSPASQQNTIVVAAEGLLRHGRNPPARFICPVSNPDDIVAPASWKTFGLSYIDASSTGGEVKASLYAKSRTSGKMSRVATAQSAGGSTVLQTSRAALRRALDFSLNAYVVVLDMDMADSALFPNEAHLIRLEN